MREGFLQAIIAEPENDTPRLIYADWLEEHGEASRAEFIRVQCELARLSPAEPRAAELRRRSVQMQAEYERDWLGEWSENLVRWRFHRGFLDEITIQPEPFLRASGELFHQHPVNAVSFVGEDGQRVADETATELIMSPPFAHVRSLDARFAWCESLALATHVNGLCELKLRGRDSETDETHLTALTRIAGAEHLRSINTLDIFPRTFTTLGDDIVDLLAEAAFTRNLVSLTLDQCALTDRGTHRLGNTRAFSRLRHLDLSSCKGISRAGIETLFNSSFLVNLAGIGLNGRADLNCLAVWPRLAQLSDLHILTAWDEGDGCGGIPNDPIGWEALASAPNLRLRRLNLQLFQHDIPGLTRLFNSPGLGGLEELTMAAPGTGESLSEAVLTNSSLGERLATLCWGAQVDFLTDAHLGCWPCFNRLEDLALFYEPFDPNRMKTVLKSPQFPSALGSLALGFFTSEPDLFAVAQCSRLESLTSLLVELVAENGAGLEALARSPHLQKLERLRLYCVEIPELSLLIQAGGLPRLRDLDISPLHTIAPDEVELLRKRFGPQLRNSAVG